MATPHAASSIKGQSYRPTTMATYTAGAASGQQYAIYYPLLPANQYPINKNFGHPDHYCALVTYNISGFNSSPPTYSDTTAAAIDFNTTASYSFAPLAWKCLMNGIAVIVVQVTSANTANAGGTVPTGRGYFHARGGVNRFYESGARPACQKDVVLAFQHIRKRAASYGLWGPSMGVAGDSAGGIIAAWIAMAPNRAWELMHGDFEISTVPSCFVVGKALNMWWDRWQNQVGTSVTSALFPKAETGGAGADDTNATDLQDCPARYKRESSQITSVTPGVLSCAPTLGIGGSTGTEPVNLDFSMPTTENVELAANIHTSWSLLFARRVMRNFWLSFADSADGVTAATDGSDITTDMYDYLHDGTTSGDGTPAGYRIEDKDAGPDIDWILLHINDAPWENSSEAMIRRTGQVETLGRFILPPGPRTRVMRLSAVSGSALVYGTGPSDCEAEGTIEPGRAENISIGSGPLWVRADSGVARYGLRQTSFTSL